MAVRHFFTVARRARRPSFSDPLFLRHLLDRSASAAPASSSAGPVGRPGAQRCAVRPEVDRRSGCVLLEASSPGHFNGRSSIGMVKASIPTAGLRINNAFAWSVTSFQAPRQRQFSTNSGSPSSGSAVEVLGTKESPDEVRPVSTGEKPCSERVFDTESIPSSIAEGGNVIETDLPPHQELGMPSLSPTMTEGNIARWLKKEGDKVSPGDVLCEVETDKATVEMECMEEGFLAKIIHGDGAKGLKVGEVIAIIVEDEGDIGKFKDYKVSAPSGDGGAEAPPEPTPTKKEDVEPVKTPEPVTSKTDEAPRGEDRIFSSPLARKLAEDHNVPLSSIKGTGPDGRILKADIEDYLARTSKPSSKAKEPTAAPSLDYSDIPNSQIRKVTASRLLLSKQTIPHYYLTVDTCVDKLMDLRAQLNALQEASGGRRISVNDLVIKAAALALRKVPQCNSSWMNDIIREYHNVNINVAVQTANGLFVPVVRDADKKGLSTIAAEVKLLAQKAKDNSLKPEDYEGGTFTVSNLGGPFGIKQFCAIINPPQAAILAVGSAERRVIPAAGPDQFEFGSFMSVTLSCDHRVIDGAIGAEWLKAFKGYIENPQSMLL